LWNGDFIHSFSTARNAIASPLLRLPAEIRHEIYAYVASVGTYKVDSFDGPTGPDFYISGPGPSWLGLLHTCRQIYAEASALPYALNTFRLVPHHAWYPWVTQLAKLRNPITTLRLEIDWFRLCPGRGGSFEALPHLQKLQVQLMTEFDVSEYVAKFSGDPERLDFLYRIFSCSRATAQAWLRPQDVGNVQVEFVGEWDCPLELAEHLKWE
jgi:hypothetical protein